MKPAPSSSWVAASTKPSEPHTKAVPGISEAAACATPVLSDAWEGIERFFTPGEEILLAGSAEEATGALDLPPEKLARIGRAARERALDEHTSDCRASRMLSLLDDAACGEP